MAITHTKSTKTDKDIIRNEILTSPSKDRGIPIGDDPDDVWNSTRNACVKAILKTFKTIITKSDQNKDNDNNETRKFRLTAESASTKYENALYKKYSYSLNAYKLRFRKDLTALKNIKTGFAIDILHGDLDLSEFVKLDEAELISKTQKEKNCKLLDDELKNKLGHQFPTNINEIKNQNVFVGEKWGISESAAKIDPEFDLD